MATQQQYDGPFQAVVIHVNGEECPVGSPQKTVDLAGVQAEQVRPDHTIRAVVVRDLTTHHTVRVVWPEPDKPA